jgi:hypothetical protein
MKKFGITVLFLGISAALPLLASADNSGRIYGIITTYDHEVYEGLIRWDKNEVSWVDILNGDKELPRSNYRDAKKHRRDRYDRDHSIQIFGLKIGGSSYDWWPDNAQSGIRFGHIKSIEVIDDDRILLTLKSGQEVELEGGSTDIGEDIRGVIIEDKNEGEIELEWDDIDRVEFSAAPANADTRMGERLFGTLTTRRGEKYSGQVCWDVDEVLTDDVIDGEERSRDRKIEFEDMVSIERQSSRSATIVFKDGEKRTYAGTNDVDDSNRGIIISDPGFGQVQVNWDEFEKIEFVAEAKTMPYDNFNGGGKIKGSVLTEDGQTFTGEIRWDNDEEYTWELLDGEQDDLDYDIEFGLIKSIEKRSSRASLVTVWDGRTFRLRDSNDVDDENKGIFVTLSDGTVEEILWEDFRSVEFEN